ncbi:BatD family protein [Roseibium litorale]|uniref:BatD family protein n=1 Tax=Roseibium litorale TaxID=2803841 RepID=UPI001785652A|nr:BatD family protein [Roseibium litorale]
MIRLALLFFLIIVGCARAETLRVLVPDSHPVAGEMVGVTIRGEYTQRIALETLTFPGSDDYDWVQLARDSWRDERVDGRTMKVFERRIALFPRSSGTLTVGPLVHHLTIAGRNGGREVLDVRAEPVTIQVAPFPAASAPLAARMLTVEDQLSVPPGELRDGETLIRRVTLRAAGTLAHFMPPRPEIRQPWLVSFTAPEARGTKLAPEGPVTTVIWEWHLHPKTGEPGVLPPVAIPWFDTVSRQMKTAEIPAIPFGYASFAANRTGSGEFPASEVATAAGVFSAGLVTGLLAIFSAATLRRGRELKQVLKRSLLLDPSRKALRAAARQDDLMALRSATEDYLLRRRTLGLPVAEGATADLDRAIYAAHPGSQPFDPGSFVRDLLRRKRRRSSKQTIS